MINPKDAEELANKTIEAYVNLCGCRNTEDVANVLMKLASMCGLGMIASVGQEEAVSRMQGTAAYLARPELSATWKREIVQ